jgi:hypothetical protein
VRAALAQQPSVTNKNVTTKIGGRSLATEAQKKRAAKQQTKT